MELDIQEFIAKANILGLEIKEIKVYRNQICKIISLSNFEHIVYIPDNVTKINRQGSFSSGIRYLRGTIKIIGGHNLTTTHAMFHWMHIDALDV